MGYNAGMNQQLLRSVIVVVALGGVAATPITPPASSLTAERVKAAQAIVTDRCNLCHADKKPLTARLVKEESPAEMTGHFKNKAELTDDEIKLMVQYLTAVSAGKAELPAVTGSSDKSVSPSKSGKTGRTGKRGDHARHEDDD